MKLFEFYSTANVVKKACLSSLSEQESEDCKNNAPSCVTCKVDGCNSANTQEEEKCIKCNSMQTPDCAQNPSKLTAVTCASSDKQCFSRVDDVRTIRDCKSILDLSSAVCEGEECSLCTGNSCNNKIYPENRLTCFQCKNDGDCRKEQKDASKNYPCLAYHKDDSCITIKSEDSVSRGCLSDSLAKCDDSNNCTSCKGNGCNKNSSSYLKINSVLLTLFLVISCNVLKSF